MIEAFENSKTAVAQALGISLSAVSQWGDIVPPHSAMRLSMLKPELPYDPEQYRDWNAKFGNRKRKSKRH